MLVGVVIPRRKDNASADKLGNVALALCFCQPLNSCQFDTVDPHADHMSSHAEVLNAAEHPLSNLLLRGASRRLTTTGPRDQERANDSERLAASRGYRRAFALLIWATPRPHAASTC
jgi:hypothetical protein